MHGRIFNSFFPTQPRNSFGIFYWLVTCAFGWIHWVDAQAATLPSIPDLNSLFPTAMADQLVKVIGLGMDHRPYQAGSGLGTNPGIDFGVELTLVQPPTDLGSTLNTLLNGSSATGSGPTIPIIPSARIHLHKGLSKKVDIGFSILPAPTNLPYLGGSFLLGGDIKVVIFEPEEGPLFALRASYNYNNLVATIDGAALTIRTATITPQFIISKHLSFAEPYGGIGYQYTWGSVQAVVPVPTLPAPLPTIAPIEVVQNGSANGIFFFGGLSMRVPVFGLKLTLEGAYNPQGMDYLGTKIGFEL